MSNRNESIYLLIKTEESELAKQLLECFGYKVFREVPNCKEALCHGDISEYDVDDIYRIATKLFGKIYLEYGLDGGSEESNSFYGIKLKYNENGKKLKEDIHYNYDYNTYEARLENVWKLLKKECEEAANQKNVTIEWGRTGPGGRTAPQGEEFIKLCNEVLASEGGLEEVGKYGYTTSVPGGKGPIKKVDTLKEAAKGHNYSELYKLIEEKYK